MIHRVLAGLTLLLSGSFVAYAQEEKSETVYECPEGFTGRLNKRILPPDGEAPYWIHDGYDKDGQPIVNIPWARCQELVMKLSASDAENYEGGPIKSPPPPASKPSNKQPSNNKKAPKTKAKTPPSKAKTPPSKAKSPPPKAKSPPPKAKSPPPPKQARSPPPDPNAPFVPMCDGINFRERFGAKRTVWGELLPALGHCYCYQPGSMLAYVGTFKSDTISCMRNSEPDAPPMDEPPPSPY